MRDRFDHTLERKLGSSVVAVRQRGIVTGPGRRREWPAAEKARIIVESLHAGANVSDVARRNGLSPQQLFGWRREARDLFAGDDRGTRAITVVGRAADVDDAPAHAAPTFVPIVVASASSKTTPPPDSPRLVAADAIEIMIGAIVVRVTGRVDAAALQTVLDIVRRLACS